MCLRDPLMAPYYLFACFFMQKASLKVSLRSGEIFSKKAKCATRFNFRSARNTFN